MYTVKQALTKEEMDAIIGLRYRILRKPWNQPFETSTDGQEHGTVNAFIADGNGKTIACGRLQENDGSIGQIRFMAVDEAYQGHGLGKLIVAFLEEKAKEKNISKIELHSRVNALKFYESQNYTLIGKSYNLWNVIQHFLMEKAL